MSSASPASEEGGTSSLEYGEAATDEGVAEGRLPRPLPRRALEGVGVVSGVVNRGPVEDWGGVAYEERRPRLERLESPGDEVLPIGLEVKLSGEEGPVNVYKWA